MQVSCYMFSLFGLCLGNPTPVLQTRLEQPVYFIHSTGSIVPLFQLYQIPILRARGKACTLTPKRSVWFR